MCGAWNSLQEQISPGDQIGGNGKKLEVTDFRVATAKDEARHTTDSSNVDTLLGGGLVAGSVVLLAGEPGIGKSTLLLQIANGIAKQHDVLYVSAEESARQVGLRGTRLGTMQSKLKLASSTSSDDIAASIMSGEYGVVIVDSIQTVSVASVLSASGSTAQVTSSTRLLSAAAKRSNTALIIVGHVTKEGTIAGPKLLEHLVDVVMQLEGDRYGGFKVLRAIKNRYGPTDEAVILEMDSSGLKPIENPSEALLAERQITDGSVVLATVEGSRPLLVEIQALVNKTSYGYPKRASSGFDVNRMNLLIAVLERRTKLALSDYDVYLNIVGGMRLADPAADLAVCLAIGSAAKGMQLNKNAAVFGEVGLSGEVRHVVHIEKRLAEAKKLGLVGAIGPAYQRKQLAGLLPVKTIKEALNTYLQKK